MRYFIYNFCLLFGIMVFSQTSNGIKQGSFAPESGKYIVSGWVKEIHNEEPLSYQSAIKVSVLGQSYTLKPSGPIIDGWQRIVGIITIVDYPDTIQPVMTIELSCDLSINECFYDDVRFFPYHGNMKSFVYDQQTQRLMAELDQNNYATYYEYDLEGGLVRVKKETEKGIMTIQETRSHSPKRDN